MIKALHIEHYALIDELDIEFNHGFSVITGETGAGKSIILGAIGLLLGERADLKAIKAGEKRCVIEAEFDLSAYGMEGFFDENDLDFNGSECIIRRELTSSGKSRAFINDTPVNLSQLKEIGDTLIDIHSQHKNLLLNEENFQLSVLDILAGNADQLNSYREHFEYYRGLVKALNQAIANSKQNHDEEDYLRFQLDQLADAQLKEGEQEQLEEEQELLSHAEEIKGSLYDACNMLTSDGEDDTISRLKRSVSTLNSIGSVSHEAEELASRIDACYIELKDIASTIESLADATEYDPQRLQQIDERLNTIYSLQKKHHVATVEELLSLQASLEEKLGLMDCSEEHIEQLKAKIDEAYKVVADIAAQLSQKRREAKAMVETKMKETLIQLGMPNVMFEVEMTDKAELDATGNDKVTFLFSANKNVPMQPISEIASGGEIARVMLSLKALIAGAVKLPTIIFDEIDTGVSGSIAEKMALIMQEMGNGGRQVISITHLPQIAALGTTHYKVYKEESLFATTTHITRLNQSQRIEEIAHMLSGSALTEAAISNAKELLKI